MSDRARAGSVELMTFPSADRAFARHVRATALTAASSSPEALQQAIRADYPRAVVRRRDLASETHVAWYVFRDGWVLGSPGEPGSTRAVRPSS
jgi:hypothetical protein